MSLLVANTSELSELEKDFLSLPSDIQKAKKSGLSSFGFFATQEVKAFMRKEGDGLWPDPHDLSLNFRKFGSFESGSSLVASKRKASQASKLSKFFKYVAKDKQNKVQTGFSFNIKSFNPKLEELVDRIIEGYEIDVTPEMRGLFGAKGFPLKKETNVLQVPPRTLDPVLQKIDGKVFDVFIFKFLAKLANENSLFLR